MKIHDIPIASIIVKDRARKDFGEVGDLAQSIRVLGLLQPLVLEDNNQLLAGERRLRALTLLNRETAPCVYLSELSELQRLRVELEENSKRKDFTWQEECSLIKSLYTLMKKEDPALTREQCADKLNFSQDKLHRALFIQETLEKNPDLAKEKTSVDAFRRSQRIREKGLRELEASLLGDLGLNIGNSNTNSPAKNQGTRPDSLPPIFTQNGITLMNIDCLEGIKTIPDESVDLLITDFPFGVDLDKNADFSGNWEDVYEDSPTHLLETLLPTLAAEYQRVLKTGAHVYIFYPSIHETKFREILSSKLTLQNIPLIWNKHFGGSCFSPYTRYTPNYEPVIFGSKGTFKETRKLAAPGFAVLNFPNLAGGKKDHPAQKPPQLIDYLIKQSTVEGELVLDTFSGSGSTLQSCKKLGRKGIAFELSPVWYRESILRLKGETTDDQE